ncbi:MAG TPA: hypothetical protein VMW35_06965 [Myxococcota bacterium]|jgi:hypothetical protein|nr:hypothetical protein [Myxococcota bacterium]
MRPASAARGALLCALACLLLAPLRARALDLTGTWYVLVHYTDDTAHDPKQQRWDDRLWTFEAKGDQLEWSEYAIVVFNDESGRFERLGGNQASRVVAAWEPNAHQLAQIGSGLEYNTRGAKKKVLRGSAAQGWRSGSAGASPAGANVLSYTETWTIDDPSGLPTFTRDDALGGGGSETLEGRTQYRAESIDADGVIHGKFERDGTRHGTFRMYPSGQAAVTKGSGKTQQQRMQEAFLSQYGKELFPDADLQRLREEFKGIGADGGTGSEADAASAAAAQRRIDLGREVRKVVEREAKLRGFELDEPTLDKISDAVTRAIASGMTPEEIRKVLTTDAAGSP